MALTKKDIKYRLMVAGVKNLQEFGYPSASIENILTDVVYASMFKSMLQDNLGKVGLAVDVCINELLAEVENVEI